VFCEVFWMGAMESVCSVRYCGSEIVCVYCEVSYVGPKECVFCVVLWVGSKECVCSVGFCGCVRRSMCLL